MSSYAKVVAVVEAVDAAMRTAFGWDSSIPIYVNGSDTKEPSGDTYGEIEVALPSFDPLTLACAEDATIAIQADGRWPLSAAGTSPGLFQLEKSLALRALLTASPRIAEAGKPKVDSIDLDDAAAREEGGLVVSVVLTAHLALNRGE